MIEIKNKAFNVVIERKRIKNMYLRLDNDTIHVTCPYYVLTSDVYAFINEKRDWIYKAYIKKNRVSKLTVSETIYYKGREYKLIILKGNKNIKFDEDTIYIRCRSGEVKDAVKVFYEYGKKVIKQYVEDNHDKYLNVLKDYGYYKIPEYDVKNLKSMWGCCYDKQNRINFSVRLIHYDPICWEAIIWHELLHFIIPNHSKRFHQVLESKMPKYKEILKSLY